MGRRGPRPTPTAVLKARGSPLASKRKKDGEPTPEIHAGAPPAPRHLKGEARQCWERVAPLLVGMRVLSDSDLNTLTRYCELWGEWRGGYDIEQRLKISAALLKIEQEFGLTPSARSRVRTKEQATKDVRGSQYFQGPALKIV